MVFLVISSSIPIKKNRMTNIPTNKHKERHLDSPQNNNSKCNTQNKHKVHIQNMHKSLQKSIHQDLQYIEENCNDDIDIECVIRWDRIASISKSTKDLLKKCLEKM